MVAGSHQDISCVNTTASKLTTIRKNKEQRYYSVLFTKSVLSESSDFSFLNLNKKLSWISWYHDAHGGIWRMKYDAESAQAVVGRWSAFMFSRGELCCSDRSMWSVASMA